MIRLENLSKYYKSENNISLGLSKINIEFNNKEFIAITGESGSGKSTLLNVISGIDSYEEGELYFDGLQTSHYDITDWENYRKENISFVFQNYGLIDSYTVYENVLTALIINNFDIQYAEKRSLEIIQQVGLNNHISHKATKLSGGQKQRLAIARAIAKDSKILVADEPTGNLDTTTGKEIIALLKEISKTKLVIIVTHDFEEVKDVVTRKIRVFDGKIAEDTIIKEVKNDECKEVVIKKTNSVNSSLFFSKLNIKSQPKRTSFTFLVAITMSLLIALVLTGYTYFSNLDTYTDIWNPYFDNINENRVVVKKDNNDYLDQDDYDILSNNKYISSMFKYDILLDTNFIVTLNNSNVLMNVESIFQLDTKLKYGDMPKNENEVVIALPAYDLDKNLIGDVTQIYNNDSSLKQDVLIVGLVEIKSYQRIVYCHEELLKEFSFVKNNPITVQMSNDNSILSFKLNNFKTPTIYNNEENTIYFSNDFKSYHTFNFTPKVGDLTNVNIVFTDELVDNECFISNDLKESMSFNSQVTLYLESSNDLFKLQEQLDNLGYDSISPYYVSLDTEDIQIVIQKISMSFLCVIIIIVIYVLGYIVLKLVFSEKVKDFGILKSIGLDKRTILNINIIEISIYFVISFSITTLLIEILSLFIKYFENFFWYHHIYLLIINLLLGLFISLRFNKYINKLTVIQTIKEK